VQQSSPPKHRRKRRSTGIPFSGDTEIPLESMMKKIKRTETRHNFIFEVERFFAMGVVGCKYVFYLK